MEIGNLGTNQSHNKWKIKGFNLGSEKTWREFWWTPHVGNDIEFEQSKEGGSIYDTGWFISPGISFQLFGCELLLLAFTQRRNFSRKASQLKLGRQDLKISLYIIFDCLINAEVRINFPRIDENALRNFAQSWRRFWIFENRQSTFSRSAILYIYSPLREELGLHDRLMRTNAAVHSFIWLSSRKSSELLVLRLRDL